MPNPSTATNIDLIYQLLAVSSIILHFTAEDLNSVQFGEVRVS